MKKHFINIIIGLLIIIESCCLFLAYKSLNNINGIKEDNFLNKKDIFAIMIEQKDGTYIESTSTKWPTDMVYNASRSGCVDNNGNSLDNALSYNSDTNIAVVNTVDTSYCYLYFDLPAS